MSHLTHFSSLKKAKNLRIKKKDFKKYGTTSTATFIEAFKSKILFEKVNTIFIAVEMT